MTLDAPPTDVPDPWPDPPEEAPPRRPWYRSTPFLVATGGLVVALGQFFVGLIAIVLLIGDRTRERNVRIGGALLIFWWAFAVASTRSSGYGPLPYVSFALLAIATVFLGRAALARRGSPWPARIGVTVLAGLAGGLAVVQLVPYGFRQPEIGKGRALELVVEQRAEDSGERIAATKALVVLGRLLVVQKPYWVVATFEPHADTAVTGDGEPCFTRVQTYFVDGLDGQVRRSTDIIEADEDRDGGCLPFQAGTSGDLVDLP